ncbi:MAG: YlbF family regulator [Ruminococcus sp.]|nr:YlbF family regulator [Ruminococcus sp.]
MVRKEMKIMTIIEQARELGAAIQQDERYLRYQEAASKSDTDPTIQKKIGEFNLLRADLNKEMAKTDKDTDRMTALDSEIRELYDEIMAMPPMVEFNEAQEALNKLIQSVSYIITSAANGEDPMTCPEEAPQCGGSCATCGGCH